MTDAELIYNALLRAERRIEGTLDGTDGVERMVRLGVLLSITAIREEIGNGLTERGDRLAIVKAKLGEVG